MTKLLLYFGFVKSCRRWRRERMGEIVLIIDFENREVDLVAAPLLNF